MKTITYKFYEIIPDKILGFSLICPKGEWCCSKTSIDALKKLIDEITYIL